MPDITPILLTLGFLGLMLVFVLCFVMVLRARLRAAKANRVEMRGDALHVPLIAAFSGWKGVPWLSRASSDIRPVLLLHPDHIECRVIRTRKKPYTHVSRVDYRRSIGTENVVLEFSDSLRSFIGNTANPEVARDAIAFLRQKGCPLSGRAEDLLSKGTLEQAVLDQD
ncbi:hypothetical protein [Rhizobium paknamense]|uniref:DUF2550 family protein n=1 Tax=Rhizobium paknamense TaxID=1206817 RepID=A0ABU0IAU2_9HYPH|nr:hypothetical protein [Rhizobium paknamense]MDQ0455340.1 hypothetical protein [Rhizobium paknamense]